MVPPFASNGAVIRVEWCRYLSEMVPPFEPKGAGI